MTKKEQEYEISSGNIFADLELDQPEEILARAKLLNNVSTLIKTSNLSQKVVAEKLGITQPKVSLLVNGQLSAFSADTLIHYLSILGCEVQIKVKKPRSKKGIFEHKGHIAVC